MRSLTRVLAAAATAAASIALAAPAAVAAVGVPAQHGIGIRLLDASVSRRDDPRAHIYIDDFMRPGTSIHRHVQVSDFTNRPMTLQMYAVASSINSAGWEVGAGRASNELTSWMRVTPSIVHLQPRHSTTVTVDIDVPTDAVKGERYATVVAELPPPPASSGSTVRVATRVGVRVYLDIGAGGEPASDFTISTLTAARLPNGTPVVSAHVTNTGARALDLGGRLTLSDGPGGLRAGPYDVDVPRTLGIGESGDVTVSLDKQTPLGPWLARMSLQSGYVKHAATGRITFPVAAGASAAPVRAHAIPLGRNRNLLVPMAALLILGLAIGLVLFLLWKRRRRREDDDKPAPFVPEPRAPSEARATDRLRRS